MNRSSLSRRSFVVAAATVSALALSACGGGGDESSTASGTGPEKDKLTVGVFTSLNALPLYVAIDNGIFTKHGLTVTPKTIQNPSAGIPQLVGNQMDFSLADMLVPIVAKSQNVPLQMVAPGAMGGVPSGQQPRAVIYVAANSPIGSVKELEGAKIGVPQIKSQVWLDVRQTVDAAGGDSAKAEFVEVPNTIAALKAGNVQAVTASEPQATQYAKDPALKELARYTPAGGNLAYDYITTSQYTAKNPRTAEAFQKAMLEANKLANSDRAKAEASALKVLKSASPAIVKAAHYPIYSEKAISAEDIDFSITRAVKYGVITESDKPKADELIFPKP